ncbi:MAG: hypothetical protein NVSMB19_23080 [Vulcanimicrobiaceae bacterium]
MRDEKVGFGPLVPRALDARPIAHERRRDVSGIGVRHKRFVDARAALARSRLNGMRDALPFGVEDRFDPFRVVAARGPLYSTDSSAA